MHLHSENQLCSWVSVPTASSQPTITCVNGAVTVLLGRQQSILTALLYRSE